VCLFENVVSRRICGVDSHLPVAHHFTHALRVSDSNFVIFLHQKLEPPKTASFLSNFEILKFVEMTVAGQNCKKDTHGAPTSFQILNFFAADLNFLTGNLSMAHHFLYP
jgi:hypothetical protein